MTMPAVALHDASKNYGKTRALKGVNLSIDAGEVVAVLGPNGAGKTTAISLMLGLRRPSAGTVALFGRDPSDPPARTRVGAMLQEPGNPGLLRVSEVIDLYRSFYPAPLPLAEVLEMADLTEQARAFPARLSGGQRQRVNFALAICGDPDLLFLDEPSTGLDVESRRTLWELVGRFARAGKTIVLTTHNLEEADALAGRIVVINQGEVIADGPPEEIKARVGGRHLRFRLPGLQPEQLAALPGVARLSVTGESVDLYTLQPETVLRALFRTDWPIADTEVVGAGLEEAFLQLTGAENGGAA